MNKLYYSGSEYDAALALGEICYTYGGVDGSEYIAGSDAGGSYIYLDEVDYPYVLSALANGEAAYSQYRSYVASACAQVAAQASEEDLVNAINAYIVNSFSYVDRDCENMLGFVQSGTGKCIHYAQLMQDMCNAFGIPCWKVHSSDHCWVNVQINGVTYRFDPTYNDLSGSLTGYSWLAA